MIAIKIAIETLTFKPIVRNQRNKVNTCNPEGGKGRGNMQWKSTANKINFWPTTRCTKVNKS